MKKYLSLLFCTIIMITTVSNVVFARGAWKKVGDNWRYENHAGAGDYVMERFKTIYDSDGITATTYYFDYFGNMVTGPVLIKGQLYIFDDEGGAVTTGFDIDGTHYSTEGNGRVVGLPINFDTSRFKSVYSVATDMAINLAERNAFDDNNNITPTAPAGN